MNREDAKKLWPIIKAFGDGEDVEWLANGRKEWMPKSETSGFTQKPSRYRIKPQEPREFKIMVMGNGKIRDLNDMIGGFLGEVIKVREVLSE